MKGILFITIILALAACLPESKELHPSTQKTFTKLKKELQIEQLQYGFKRKVSDGDDQLQFDITLFDIDVKEHNYDSISKVLYDGFQRSGYELEKCKDIGIFYYSKYKAADVWRIYILDGNGEIIEIDDENQDPIFKR